MYNPRTMRDNGRRLSISEFENKAESLLEEFPQVDVEVEVVSGAVDDGRLTLEEGIRFLGDLAMIERFLERTSVH